MRRRLADVLTALALRLYPGGRFFDPDDGPLTGEHWAGKMMVLHAEAVHGCEHTEQAPRELGMAGPRGKAAAVGGLQP